MLVAARLAVVSPPALPAVVARRFALHARGEKGATATFDAEGRLISFRLGGAHFRRGLDGTVVRLTPGGPGSGAPWRAQRAARPEGVLADLRDSLGDLEQRAQTAAARRTAGRAAHGLAERWATDMHRFRDVLGCVPIVPPLHVRSVVLRLTEGCGYGRCRFCTLYETVPFRVREPDEWRAHVEAVLDWFGDGAGLRPSLWIGDASILEAGIGPLLGALETLRERVTIMPADVPRGSLYDDPLAFEGMYAFADVPRAAQLLAQDAAALADAGVRRLYLGLESGHVPLLRRLRKPHDGRRVREAVERLHAGGIAVGVVVLVGAGGAAFEHLHHDDTVALVGDLGLGAGDLVLVSPLDDHARAGASAGEQPLDGVALAAATQRLSRDLVAAVPREVRVTDYGLDGFVY